MVSLRLHLFNVELPVMECRSVVFTHQWWLAPQCNRQFLHFTIQGNCQSPLHGMVVSELSEDFQDSGHKNVDDMNLLGPKAVQAEYCENWNIHAAAQRI